MDQPSSTRPPRGARPPSPWPGSEHAEQHHWQLDRARDLGEAAEVLRALAAQLRAAHVAGWALREPVRRGLVVAARASRRTCGDAEPVPLPDPPAPPEPRRLRLRLVDEPPQPGEVGLDLSSAPGTPVLAASVNGLRQVAGPASAGPVLEVLSAQVSSAELGDRRWGLVRARVGPGLDLVADGTALRVHALSDGVLVRTAEPLAFRYGADDARTLPAAAAAYERLAVAADAMSAAGGRLVAVDDGFMLVGYALA